MADNQQYGPLAPKQTSANDIRKVIANGPKAIGQGSTIATSDELKKKEVDKANSNPKVPTTTKKQSTTTKTNTNVVAPKQTNTVVKKPETQGVNKFASLMQGQISGDLFKNPAVQPINDIKVVKQDNEATHNAAPNNNNDISFMNNFGRAKELKDTVDIDNALMDLYSDIKVKVDNGTLASSDVAKMKQAYPEFANMGDDVLLSMIGDMASIANKKMPFNDVNMKKLKSLYPELNSAAWGFDKGSSENMYQAGGMREQMAQSSKTDLNRFGTVGAVAEGVINPLGEATTLLDMGAQMIPQVDGSGNENRLKKALSKLTDEDINKYYEQYQNYVKNHGTLSKLYTTQLEGDTVVEQLWNWATGKGKKDVDAGFRDWLIDRVNNEVNGWAGEVTGAANELKGVGGPNVAKMYANMPASTVKTVTAITRAITNPVDTAAGLYHLFGTEEGRQALISRYGSWDGFAKALEQDPVGVASDGLAVVEGGAGLTKMATGGLSKASLLAGLSTEALGAARTTENLLKLATRLENMAVKAGKIEKTAGLASNLGADLPINKVINGLREWGESGESMIQKAAKYSANASQTGIGTVAGKAIDEGKKIIKEGPINTIANKLMGSASDTDKLFKAASPNLNKLTNNVNYKNKRQNMDIATQAIVDAGYTPKSLSEWAKAHTETLNKKWNEFKKMIKDKSDFEVDVKDLLTEVKDYIKREREGATEAQKADLRKLEVEVNNIERRGKVDMGFIENRKEHYNSSWRDADKLKVGDIYLKGIKLIGNAMRKQQDNILGKGPEQTKKLRKEIAALMDTKEDVIKADVRNQKKKSDIAGGGLIESYGRLSGLGDFIGGTLSTLTKGGEGLAQAGKGIGKMILGNAMGRARDVDYLTKKGFEGLSNKKKAQNNVGGLKNKFQESKELGELYVERDNLRKELKKDNISDSRKEAINKRLDDIEYAIAQKKARAGLGDKERTLDAESKKKVIDMVSKRAKDVGFTTEVLDGMEKDTQGYTDLRNKLIALEKNPGDTTAQHELFHAFFSVVDNKTKTYILDEAKKILKESGMKDVNAEEWLAESFGIYAKRKMIKLGMINAPKGFVAKVRNFFQKVYEYMQRFNGDRATINKVFDEVLGDRQMKNGIIDLSDLLGDKEVKVRELGDNGLRNKSVYHGSPADFDKFDSSHMGEGEGAQAHGWGHYVAVEKGTAKHYADMGKFKNNSWEYDGQKVDWTIAGKKPDWEAGEEIARNSVLSELNRQSINNKKYTPEQAIKDLRKEWTDIIEKDKEAVKDTVKSGGNPIFFNNRIYKYEKWLEGLDKLEADKFKDNGQGRNLYNLDIPDPVKKDTPTGSNYLEEGGQLTREQVNKIMNTAEEKMYGGLKEFKDADFEDARKIANEVFSDLSDKQKKISVEEFVDDVKMMSDDMEISEAIDKELQYHAYLTSTIRDWKTKAGLYEKGDYGTIHKGKELYNELSYLLGSEKEASKFLESLGYDGIHYFGGRDGEAYVIFNDDALKIKDHIRYKKKIGDKDVEINKDITSPNKMVKINDKGYSVIKQFISEKQAEKALDVSKELLDNKGNPYMWTHTNKYNSEQFANFINTKDSKYKEFTDNEIAWFTNNEDMSKSYGNWDSILANTKPYKSVSEFNNQNTKVEKSSGEQTTRTGIKIPTESENTIGTKIIEKDGKYNVVQVNEGKFTLDTTLDNLLDDMGIAKEGYMPDNETKHTLSRDERIERVKWEFAGSYSWGKWDVDIKELPNGKVEVTRSWNKTLGKYDSEKAALAEYTASKTGKSKYHYQGIIQNIKNPLVVDIKGEGDNLSFWNKLGNAYDFLKKSDEKGLKSIENVQKKFDDSIGKYVEKRKELDNAARDLKTEYYNRIKDDRLNNPNLTDEERNIIREENIWKGEEFSKALSVQYGINQMLFGYENDLKPNQIEFINTHQDFKKIYDDAKTFLEDNKEMRNIVERPTEKDLMNWAKKNGLDNATAGLFHGMWIRGMDGFNFITELKRKELQTNDYVFYALNKGGYDGVLFKGITDYGHEPKGGWGMAEAGDVLAAFKSSDFKAWDNANPTDSKYISYKKKVSLDKKSEGLQKKNSSGLLAKGRDRMGDNGMRYKKDIPEDKKLIGLHNLSVDKLRKTVELGGMPMPSIAVTKKGIPHTDYGDVTFIMKESAINPKLNRNNKLYTVDGYTPMAQQPIVKMKDTKDAWAIEDKIEKETGLSYSEIEQWIDNKEQMEYYHPELKKFDKEYNQMTEKKLWGGFTPSGKRRYLDYNLDNVVKKMKENKEDAFNGMYWKMVAQYEGETKTVDSLRERNYGLKNKEVGEELFNRYYSEVGDLYAKLGGGDSFREMGYFQDTLSYDYDRNTDKWLEKVKKDQPKGSIYEKLQKSDLEKLQKTIKEGAELQRPYSEAKPERGIRFDEVGAVVAPEGKLKEVKDILKDTGLKVYGYKEGERMSTIDKVADDNGLRFKKGYHGSKADFDKFDSSHMGEGEGNQAHGYGHYIAATKKTAKGYAQMGGNPRLSFKGLNRDELADRLIDAKLDGKEFPDGIANAIITRIEDNGLTFKEAKKEAIKTFNNIAEEYKANGEMDKFNQTKKEIKTLEGLQRKEFEMKKGRNLYTVEIPDSKKANTPSGENYLNEEKLYGKKVYEKIFEEARKNKGWVNNKGAEWYIDDRLKFRGKDQMYGVWINKALEAGFGNDQKAVAKFLEGLGYDGIEYKGLQDGKAYVIFKDNDIEIKDHIRYKKGLQKKGNGLHKKSNASILAKGRDRK